MYLNPALAQVCHMCESERVYFLYVSRKVLFIFLNSRADYSDSNLVVKVIIWSGVISLKLLHETLATETVFDWLFFLREILHNYTLFIIIMRNAKVFRNSV